MKPSFRSDTHQHLPRMLTFALGYVSAIIFPWIGIYISDRVPALHGTPMAVGFASIAGITLFSGLWPGIVASLANAVVFNYFAMPPNRGWAYGSYDILHTAIIFLIGLLVISFCQRQRSIEERLRMTLASLQALTDSLIEAQQGSNSATWTYNVATHCTDWTEGGAEIFGRPFSGIPSFEATVQAIAEEDRARFTQAAERALRTGETFRVEFRVPWPNGEIHWLESRGKPSPADPQIWRGVTIDITDRKNTQDALVRSEKLAAIGRLSATIAHEINNPLEAVTNLLYLASSDATLDSGTKGYLRDADRELARLANIVRRTLTFVRPKSPTGPADLCDVAESVVAMFMPRCISRNAQIRFIKTHDFQVAVPSDDLWQILTNLISNACDALIGSGGLIEICARQENGAAAIYVRDNGAGITAEDIDHIFDPFFTTKEDVGTGIGLWVTRDLVEKSGGRITVRSGNLPSGFQTMFRIEFPLVSPGAPTPRQQSPAVYNQSR